MQTDARKLTFLSFDRIAFAHTLVMPEYHYDLNSHGYGIYGDAPEHGGILEIGFIEKNPLLCTGPDFSFIAEEQSVFIIPPETDLTVRTVRSGMHRHTSVEFLISCLPDEGSPEDPRCFCFPMILPPDGGNEAIIHCIRSILASRAGVHPHSYFEECSYLMTLMKLISERMNELQGKGTSVSAQQRLCAQAKEYISAHLSEPIRVCDIAEEVGVSKNYLSQVFGKCEGQTPIEYINRLKLSHLVTVVRKYGCTLSEAGVQVGLHDVNYISRLFRVYYGMTFSEYMRSSGR